MRRGLLLAVGAPALALVLGLGVGAGTEIVPAAARSVAGSAAAQGVPTTDGTAIGRAIDLLADMRADLGVQRDKLDDAGKLDVIKADQLAVLDRMTEALTSAGWSVPAALEGAGPVGAETVYPQGPPGPLDARLFGEGRETVEMMVVQVAGEYAPWAAPVGLSPTKFRALFQALVKQESRFDVSAQSHVGAYGLAQLMPDTASDLGRDRHVPVENLRGGADYLTQQLSRFGNVPHALAAYNAGPDNVSKHGGVPPFEETRTYVRKITGYYNEYLTRIGGPDALGTIDPSDMALAEWSNTADAASLYAASSHASALAVVERLRAIVQGIDAQPDVTAAMHHNTYARAELGRVLSMRVRLKAADAVRRGAHGGHLAAERLAERGFLRMGVTP